MLKGKTAVITGSGRGIGKAIAVKLASLGANIVINDIPQSTDADATCEEIKAMGVGAICIKGDVRNIDDVKALVDGAVKEFGKIDIFVNNAGVTRDGLMLRMSEEDWDLVLDINLKGAFHCIKTVARPMMKAKGGSIINIASVVGVMGNAGQANYSASKAGLIGLTKTTAKEFSSRGIRCNAVAPGFIASAMTDKLSDEVKQQYFDAIPLGKFGTVDNIADTVAFLASDMSSYITGQVICVDGGLVM
ncbi:MAG TPA: 3-oxoacyl-[acyl-carrier-protein] reductase [Candidatus Ornithomonoglobus merdipullorum]|uniref:3-oxoacyl-[acyl-carrier-protein] reductase n=1 Tax=Candidatus Ornithomonoglobus merdipullorum TaxID=2840895 RepID=A0A9D1MB41_9FIRM|nr:3-oxoacyl-[acyl-carrier-protein] reductase [Candidatus Ornithomonoglobus merdipullorum]